MLPSVPPVKEKRPVLVLIAVCWCILLPTTGLATNGSAAQKVLVLNSYHPSYVWGESVVSGIRSVLESSQPELVVRYEYMDTKYHRPELVFDLLRQLYAVKYADVHFDVILATDNNALDFLVAFRDELFGPTPVVFCGINGFHEIMLKGKSGFTGMAESYDLRGTLELALKLHPQTRNIAFVSGTSTSSLINQARMYEILPDYSDRIELIDLTKLNPPELKIQLENLPDDTILIYLSYYKMPDGTFLTVAESTSFVFKHSGVPIYSPWEYTMGHGIVGGMMLSGTKEGRKAANYALRILEGIPMSQLPILYTSEITPIFDYNMLRYFGIPMADLPRERVMTNEPQTLYYRYKYYIWAIIAFTGYQSLVIFWLSRNLLRRKRAERQQKKLEAQLLHSQKMEAIGTFAGGIAHDLNNILGAISNCSEVALEDTPDQSPVHEDLEHILNATNRGKSLIRQILDFSRKRDQGRKRINVKTILQECLRLLQLIFPPTIEIRTSIGADNSFIMADPGKIHQVIMNLCTNAEQAMRGQSGILELSLEQVTVTDDQASIALGLDPGYYARLTVADTGPGISPELQSRVFEPFFTTRATGEGTGLGLAVVHGIITGYGGTVSLESQEGKGTVFTVYLPCREEKDLEDQPLDAAVPLMGSERILLVDDDVDLLYSQVKMLERLGYRVTGLAGSQQAVEIFNGSPDAFDLVLTDQFMPHLTGLELAGQVKALRPEIPVVLCSGLMGGEREYSKDTMQQAGVSHFVQKPFNRVELSITLRKALDESKQQGARQ